MRIDGIQLAEGSAISNATIASGVVFPGRPDIGEMFYRTDLKLMYAYDGGQWSEMANNADFAAHIVDDTRHVTPAENTFLDTLDLTNPTDKAIEVNRLAGLRSNVQIQIDSLNTTVSDGGVQLSNVLSDNVLSRDEKPDLRLEWERMNAEYSDIRQKATTLGVSAIFVDNYDASINSLNAYLQTLGSNTAEWVDFTKDTPMNGESLRTLRRDFYTQRQALLNATVAKAGELPLTNVNLPTSNSDLTNKLYVDNMDYLNLNPKAGLTSADSAIPIYSDFKFSLGMIGSAAFTLMDRDSKQVVYYTANTPTGKVNTFRAYRFSDNEKFIFDNDPISATFLNANERVAYILNIGTNFVVLRLVTETIPYNPARIIIAKTNGSSRWQDWAFAYDVSSLYSMVSNWALIQDPIHGDRILQTSVNPGNDENNLIVYDSSLTVLRTQRLFTRATDSSDIDYTGAGRHGGYVGIGYYGFGFGSGFTWNPATETFHQVFAGYYVGQTAAGVSYGQSTTMSLSWSVPRSWLMTGTGTPSNLIPVKPSGFRYHSMDDSTWDTEDGGMSGGYANMGAGNAISIVADEYSGELYLSTKGTWTTNDIGIHNRLAAGGNYKTFGYSISVPPKNLLQFTDFMPDGSAWSKSVSSGLTQVIGNQVSFNGSSVRYGSQTITTTFSTTSFGSAYVTGDTLKLDAANAKLNVISSWPFYSLTNSAIPGNYGTVVKSGGIPVVYWVKPGFNIYTATASGTTRTYADTGFTVPTIPATLNGITGLTYRGSNTWNGSLGGAAIVWAIVGNSSKYYVAKLVSGTWSIASASIFDAEIAAATANRGDGLNSCHIGDSGCVLTESGKWLADFAVPYISGNGLFTSSFDTVTNTMRVESKAQFTSINAGKPGGYAAADMSGTANSTAYGYSTTFGYFVARPTSASSSICFMTSKDPRGIGAPFTEAQWYAGTDGSGPTRYEVFLSCEAATGLVAYLSEYPIFLGGYYTKIPTTTLTLKPNAVNYVYATKSPADRTTVIMTADTGLLPNSFARMKIAAITTNDTAIVSSIVYSFDGIGLPPQEDNAGKILKTDGSVTYWDDDFPSSRLQVDPAGVTLQLSDHRGLIVLSGGVLHVPASMPTGFEVTVLINGGSTPNVPVTPAAGVNLYWMGDGNGAVGPRIMRAAAYATFRKTQASWLIFGQGIT